MSLGRACRIARIGLALAMAGCIPSPTEGSLVTTLSSGEFLGLTLPSHWASCIDGVGCLFRGAGYNEGPACATGIQGIVRFADADGNQIFDSKGQQTGAMFDWETDPRPDGTVEAGEPFTSATVGRVPQGLVRAAARYVSFVTIADLSSCG